MCINFNRMHRLFIAHHISGLLKGRQFKLQLGVSASVFVLSFFFAGGLIRFVEGKELFALDFPGLVVILYALLNFIYILVSWKKAELNKQDTADDGQGQMVSIEDAIGESIS